MASDLRTLLAILRILHEIELTAGLMRNVARATRRLYPRELPPRIRGIIERMGAQAGVQTRLAVDAFADEDAAIATALPDMDDVMDDLQKELFRAIFVGFAGPVDEAALQMAVQLAFVGRDYERAADHAVMIGRWVSFMVTGALPGDSESNEHVHSSNPLFGFGSCSGHVNVNSDPLAVLTLAALDQRSVSPSAIAPPEDSPVNATIETLASARRRRRAGNGARRVRQ